MSFIKISEQPSLYDDLEKKSVREILEDINTEDQKVALAVQKTIPQLKNSSHFLFPACNKEDESSIWVPAQADV